MNRIVLIAAAAYCVFGPLRATAQDFVLPTPAEVFKQLRTLPALTQPRPTPVGSGMTRPDESKTPGRLCTPEDPNFQEYRYEERIAYCRRNIPEAEKRQVAAAYGVPWEQRRDYEFDHRIPLCMGGSDDSENLWPQPLEEAHIKDKLEDELCRRMQAGTLKQKDGVARMLAWPD